MGVCLLLPVVIPADPDLMYINVISFQRRQLVAFHVWNNTLRMVHPDSFRSLARVFYYFRLHSCELRSPNTTPVDPCLSSLSVHANDSSVPEGTKGFV